MAHHAHPRISRHRQHPGNRTQPAGRHQRGAADPRGISGPSVSPTKGTRCGEPPHGLACPPVPALVARRGMEGDLVDTCGHPSWARPIPSQRPWSPFARSSVPVITGPAVAGFRVPRRGGQWAQAALPVPRTDHRTGRSVWHLYGHGPSGGRLMAHPGDSPRTGGKELP
jgi:hypothetical protein